MPLLVHLLTYASFVMAMLDGVLVYHVIDAGAPRRLLAVAVIFAASFSLLWLSNAEAGTAWTRPVDLACVAFWPALFLVLGVAMTWSIS